MKKAFKKRTITIRKEQEKQEQKDEEQKGKERQEEEEGTDNAELSTTKRQKL
jgi:hypothetical protein